MKNTETKLAEFTELRSQIESPAVKLTALKHEIDRRNAAPGRDITGRMMVNPDYGTRSDAGYAELERRELRARFL